jgi:hypothetical protein
VYVPADAGATVLDPLRLWLPDQVPLAVQEVALVELQVSVEELPCTTEVGLTLMVTVGAGVVTGGVPGEETGGVVDVLPAGVGDPPDPPPPQADRPRKAAKITSLRVYIELSPNRFGNKV